MSEPGRKTISQLRAEARTGALVARVHAQIEEIVRKDASNGKPFWEIRIRDAADSMTLKAWSDSPNFSTCEGLERGMPVAIEGEFSVGIFGLDAKSWSVLALPENEAQELLQGGEAERAAAQAEFDLILQKVNSLTDPQAARANAKHSWRSSARAFVELPRRAATIMPFEAVCFGIRRR